MAEREHWQVSTDAAEVYESCFVPAIFGAWAGPVADAAGIRRGDRVLDAGCGTGVLAREALRRAGEQGQVAGLDLNEGMLSVAARTEPSISWRQGDAASLREMWRTLAPGGRLAVAAWASIDHAPGFQILRDVAGRACGREAADVLAAPFVIGDQAELGKLFADGGISGAEVALHEGSIRFPSIQEFVRIEVKGSPLAGMLSDDAMQSLATGSEPALAKFVVSSGEIVMPIDAHIVTASKG
jgi:SAM-dependent methyltransferase